MLLLGSSFAKFPILSLRTGTVVGSVVGHLINPHKLRVDALWCRVPASRELKLLLQQDIREISLKGVIIDDADVMVFREEVVRLDSIISLKYELLDKRVISGRIPIGKVADYAVDRDALLVQKLYIVPTILGKLKSSRLTVDRALIIEVSPKYVKVRGGEVMEKTNQRRATQAGLSSVPSSASASFTEE